MLKRVSGIDVTSCVQCGGAVRIVARIETPTAILDHFEKHGAFRHDAEAPVREDFVDLAKEGRQILLGHSLRLPRD